MMPPTSRHSKTKYLPPESEGQELRRKLKCNIDSEDQESKHK